MAITSVSDFTGEVNIAQNKFTSSDLTAIITRVEYDVLVSLFGYTLYKAFSDDNFGQDAGSEQRYKDLLNGVDYTDPNEPNYLIRYEGIKRMLRYFIYSEYLKHQYSYNTIIGQVKGNSANSENMTGQYVNETCEYFRNLAIELYKMVKKFIEDTSESEETATSIIDQTGDVYLVSLSDTSNIYDGDKVTIGGQEYTVSNLIANTSFEISETSGTVFSDLVIKIDKYRYFDYTEQKKTYLSGLL